MRHQQTLRAQLALVKDRVDNMACIWHGISDLAAVIVQYKQKQIPTYGLRIAYISPAERRLI